MKAKNWVKKKPTKLSEQAEEDTYEKVFELLGIESPELKEIFRKLGRAIVQDNDDEISEAINDFQEKLQREFTDDELDKLMFLAELAERGPEGMEYRELYETYYPKKTNLLNVKKIPKDIFYWKDSQGIDRNLKSKYKKPTNSRNDRGLFGKLA